MSIGVVTLIMFGCLFLCIFLGIPIAWAMGGVATLSALFLWGPEALGVMALHVWKQWTNSILMCIPLFFLLANLLQRSGMAEDLYEMMYRWLGGLKGGLAIGTVVICTIFAAISGITSAGIITMALIALPSMLKRNYDKNIVLGGIVTGGALGSLIPPSVIMILYAYVARESIGRLWFGGFMPGFLTSALFITYIAIRCYLNPRLGPALPPEERVGWSEKLGSMKAVVLPLLVILLILTTIYLGICTPTEAAVIGCLGMLMAVGIHRRLTWSLLRDSLYPTFRLSGMIFWVLLGITCFNAIYVSMGAKKLVEAMVLGFEVSPFAIIAVMMVIVFFLGMIMDDFAIILICAPIFVPIVKALGFNPIWYGILFVMNIQIAYCTPPYGFSLFMMRTVVPEGITMGDIYRSVYPFVLCQVTALVMVMFFPQIALWLPGMMITK